MNTDRTRTRPGRDIAKIAAGTALLIYAIGGYLYGAVLKIPSRHGISDDLWIDGDGLKFTALGYLAFGLSFYAWALPTGKRSRTNPRRLSARHRRFAIAALAIAGITRRGSVP